MDWNLAQMGFFFIWMRWDWSWDFPAPFFIKILLLRRLWAVARCWEILSRYPPINSCYNLKKNSCSQIYYTPDYWTSLTRLLVSQHKFFTTVETLKITTLTTTTNTTQLGLFKRNISLKTIQHSTPQKAHNLKKNLALKTYLIFWKRKLTTGPTDMASQKEENDGTGVANFHVTKPKIKLSLLNLYKNQYL